MTQDDYIDRRAKEAIHSGHFMVSFINDLEILSNDDAVAGNGNEIIPRPVNQSQNVPVPFPSSNHRTRGKDCANSATSALEGGGFDFQYACKETSKNYKFGSRSSEAISIDASLSMLFQRMTVAFGGGKLTTPKWKNFTGTKLKWKEKIRLNNVIWRTWHMQFVNHAKPTVCQFATPIENEFFSNTKGFFMEGKYWKFNVDTLLEVYKLWRTYKVKKKHVESTDSQDANSGKENSITNINRKPRTPPTSLGLSTDDDALMDFNDSIFSSLSSLPFSVPDPKEIARGGGLADFIQPGLIQLQPNLDDFMDTFEPFPYFNFKQTSQNEPNVASSLNAPDQVRSFSDYKTQDVSQVQPQPNIFTSPTEPLPPTPPNLPETNIDSFKIPLSSPSIFKSNDQFQSFNLSQMPLANSNFNEGYDNIIQAHNLPPIPTTTNSSFIPNYLNCPPTISNEVNLHQQQPVVTAPNIATLPPISLSSSIVQPQFYEDSISSQIPSTSISNSMFCQPTMTALQPKAKRSSVPAVSPKSPASRRISQPAGTKYHRGRACVPIAPNIGQKFPSTCDINSSLQTVLSNVNNAPVSSMLTQNTVLAQVLSSGTYSGMNTITSTPNSQSLTATIINSMSSTEAKSTNNIISTPSYSQPSSVIAPSVFLSPVALASMTGMTDFQSRVLVGAANKVFTDPGNHPNLPNGNKLPIAPISASRMSPVTDGFKDSSDNVQSGVSHPRINRNKSVADQVQYKEHRRVVHINAEQKRRFNIKYGFDIIHELVPSVRQNASSKISKAQMLQKAAEYIKYLKNEKTEMMSETDRLKKKIENLNEVINMCQTQLPITGAPVARPNNNVANMYEEYVRKNTLQNWKFWIFSIIIQPLFEKYDQIVSTSSMEEFCSSVLSWLDQYCSLVFFRPAVSNSLRRLSTTTDILSNPSSIEQEATKAVSKGIPITR